MDHNNTKSESNADSKENQKSPKNCDGSSKTKPSVPVKRQGLIMSVLIRITHIWPIKYVFKILRKIASFTGLSKEVENVGSADLFSKRRRFLSGKKRIGRLARLILFITPYRLQCALGYRPAESLGKAAGDEDIKKSPLKPSGKGNKRKQDDVEMEEYHSWVSFMADELPEEDQEDDPTYEPSNSGTDDSEENKTNNETESDIEVEEQDGVVMLKESPKVTETPASEKTDEDKNESSENTEQITSSAE